MAIPPLKDLAKPLDYEGDPLGFSSVIDDETLKAWDALDPNKNASGATVAATPPERVECGITDDSGVLKTGLADLEEKTQGGFRHGEIAVIGALEHKHKSGLPSPVDEKTLAEISASLPGVTTAVPYGITDVAHQRMVGEILRLQAALADARTGFILVREALAVGLIDEAILHCDGHVNRMVNALPPAYCPEPPVAG